MTVWGEVGELGKDGKDAKDFRSWAGAIFTSVPSTGGQHPEPAASAHAFFPDRDALEHAHRMEPLHPIPGA